MKGKKKSVLWKIIYWSLSVLLVISLFFIIFAAVFFLGIYEIYIPKVLGFSFCVLGTGIIFITFLKYASTEDQIAEETEEEDEPENMPRGISILGLSFTIGGLLYSFNGKIEVMIIFLWIPVIVTFIPRFFSSRGH